MNTDKKVLYTVSVLITAALLPLLLVSEQYIQIIAAALSAAAAVVVCFLIRKRSIYAIVKQEVLLLMAVTGALAVMLIYLSGLSFGFYRSPSPLSGLTLLVHVLPLVAIIVTSELIRAVLRAQSNRVADACSFLYCLLIELAAAGGVAGRMTHGRLMDLVALTLFPAITANLLYHYVSKRYGPYPNMVYRALMGLYAYIIPVLPAIPDSLMAFVLVVLPLAVLSFLRLLYEKKKKQAAARRGWWQYVAIGISLVLMISVVMLISCQFRFGALVIATESMTGEINKGDMVIYEAYDDQIIEKGQVLVFYKDRRLTVHRVDDITRINGETRYYTKGDANDSRDYGYITERDIEGVVHAKVAYVGYPSLWLRGLFKKGG
ncbi:MAG: signal peptidase I [Clostridia bacterium]|nr:signal peptidase I [Clostridia bacterium]